MENNSNLLEQLIEYMTKDLPSGCKETVEKAEKINGVRNNALRIVEDKYFYLENYDKRSNDLSPLTRNPNNFRVNNKTHHKLHIIICDEVIKLAKTEPSMCDYLLEDIQNNNLIVMCELKKSSYANYKDNSNKAKSQLQKTFNILREFSCCSSSEIYGVIGMISALEGSIMQKAFKTFTDNPLNRQHRNRPITLKYHDGKCSVKTYITNNITISNNQPYIDFDKK